MTTFYKSNFSMNLGLDGTIMMSYLRGNWYNIGMVVAIGTLLYSVFAWQDMGILQLLLLLNFAGILIHQFEEYGWPGGGPPVMNMVMQPSSTANPDRYPLNQNSAMVCNVIAAYVVYLVPVFFPNIIWLGLAPIIFGMMQFLLHGIIGNIKLRMFYNPGLAAVVIFHIPIGIYYLYHILSSSIVGMWDLVFTLVYLIFIAGILLRKMTYDWLADENSPYPFSEKEMERWNVEEKIARINARSQAPQPESQKGNDPEAAD